MPKAYYQFTSKSRLDKAVNTLVGLVEGMAADRKISDDEMHYLAAWLHENEEYAARHPFNEIIPQLSSILTDDIITEQERLDLLWLCDQLRSQAYYDKTTADIQRLHAIVAGIASDGVVTQEELESLSAWLEDHGHLRTCWPYDEIDALITSVMADHEIDFEEQEILLEYFNDFSGLVVSQAPGQNEPDRNATIHGICSACPTIEIADAKFCFTGESARYPREELHALVLDRGGYVVGAVSPKVNYLVIGADGNPCWKYACYGRKIEQAVKLRQKGHQIVLVHENDFHDAL